MAASFSRSRTVLILPLILLTVALLEDIATYKVRQHVAEPRVRVAIMIVLTGAVFAFVAGWLGPWIKRLLSTARQGSQRGAGVLGLWLFYACAYGALYYAYLIVDEHGPGALLPPSLR